MNFFSSLLDVSEVVLDLLLLVFLLRGPIRKHLMFAVYVVTALAADLVDNVAYYRLGWRSAAYYKLFWTDRTLLDLLLFVVVIVFTYEALGDSKLRPKAAKALGVILAVALILPFAWLHGHHGKQYGFFTNRWFMDVSQSWNFGAGIMNLVLWTALLSNRRRDPELVTLSIGLGVITSGAAIAWGARQWLAAGDRWLVDAFMSVTHLIGVSVWCWVFRPKTQRPGNAVPPNALTTPS